MILFFHTKSLNYTKVIIFILLFFVTLSFSTPLTSVSKAENLDYDFTANALLLMEAETGKILYEDNPDEPKAPASLTKIMTLVLGLEALEEGEIEWEETTTISENARIPFTGEQSVMGFDRVGQEVKLSDIFKGIAVVSGNDGSIALAEHLHGSVESFVDAMNEKTSVLEMENTNFANPHGLDHKDQYMSAKDVGVLSRYAVNNTPKILELESILEFQFGSVEDPQRNRNLLLPGKIYEYEGADGLKTGKTSEAGASFVGTAKRNGMRLIAVVLDAPDINTRFIEARELLDYGFNNYNKFTVFEKGDNIGEAPVNQGTEHFVSLATSDRLNIVTKLDDPDKLDQELDYREEITAPVEKGEIIGELKLYDNDELIASIDVEAAESVDELGFFGKILRSISNFLSNLWNSAVDWFSDLL